MGGVVSTTWSTRRCVLVIAVLVAAWCWAAGQGSAAQSGDPDPSYGTSLELDAAPARQQRISDRACRFLVARGFNVDPCPRVYLTAGLARMEGMPANVVAVATAAGTVLDPTMAVWSDEVEQMGGRMMPPTDLELRVHLHELLHRLHATQSTGVDAWGRVALAAWSWTAGERSVEEWAVEAVTMDLLPIAQAKMDPGNAYGEPELDAYARGVRIFRAMSARAVGASWRSRAARSWRAWFVRQPMSTRVQALASIGVHP